MFSKPSHERIVVSVGGSLIVPDAVDTEFLKKFRALILKKVSEGTQFYIITGGGKTARRYRDAALAANNETTTENLDWVGIAACRVNAELMRAVFNDNEIPAVVLDTRTKPQGHSPIVIAGGVRPGNSSDWAAVQAAKTIGAKKLVNLSNIDYVYTADPRINPEATKIEKASWKEFRELLPKEWDPGLSSPFDPIAAKEAEGLKLEVAVINGAKLEEFEKYLNNEGFAGTIIR